MSIELKVPVFPESVADGTILTWNKKPGDVVKRDESLVEIETDKVVFEVPAPKDGVLEEILEDAGAVVASDQLIGRMREETVTVSPGEPETVEAGVSDAQAEAPFATPSARKLIDEKGLDIHAIDGTGSGNRILKEDELAALEQASEPKEPETVTRKAAPTPQPVVADGERPEKRVPMTRLRARIAERLLEAQHNAAMLTTFNEVNMQPVMELRARHRDAFEKRFGVRLGFMSFFVKAAIEGLRNFPELNASIDGTDIV